MWEIFQGRNVNVSYSKCSLPPRPPLIHIFEFQLKRWRFFPSLQIDSPIFFKNSRQERSFVRLKIPFASHLWFQIRGNGKKCSRAPRVSGLGKFDIMEFEINSQLCERKSKSQKSKISKTRKRTCCKIRREEGENTSRQGWNTEQEGGGVIGTEKRREERGKEETEKRERGIGPLTSGFSMSR